MKTVSIQELNEQTAKLVRDSVTEEIVVTENGHPLAVLKGLENGASKQKYWEERERKLARLPHLADDSTEFVSQDRDRG